MEFRTTAVTPFVQNCTLLICPETKEAALVDPGGDIDKIRAMINAADVTVKAILLTHGHVDHVAAVADLKEELNVPVIGPHKDDHYLIQNVSEYAANFGFPPARPFVPDRWLNHGEHIEFGEQILDVYHCPGHSPGHVIFVDQKGKLIVMGDVLFRGSIGRTDLPNGSMEALLNSIKEHVLPLGDDMQFIPGHGRFSTVGEERKNNPFLQHF
ncbi:Hydroxyacylglutathione hydrolase GloC [Halomonadaceae bacterium LMG 33818]|uniref:MBL fold metallo-hydrolase n=1 Tax=Cernens ardua TaxID=3402176 RepID=UPI003EDBCFE4